MKKDPLVSVLISTYNSDFYLEKTIASIAKEQTYLNIELIVTDNGSTNGTQDKLLALQRKYPFKLLFLEKNSGGPSKPLNEGLKVSRGQYIAVCSHDDYFLPDKVAKQVSFLEKNPDKMMVYSDCYTVFNQDEGNPKKIKALPCRSGLIFRDLFLQKFYIPALTVMVRKEVFDSVGYFDESLMIDDWDMWLRIAHVFPIGYLNEYLACYRIHGQNITITCSTKMIEDRMTIINKWNGSPYYSAALSLNRLIDGLSAKGSYAALVKDAWIALINLKQPYRILRLFLSNVLRKLNT